MTTSATDGATGGVGTTGFLAGERAIATGGVSSPTAHDLARLPLLELVARYRFGVEVFDSRIFELEDEQLDRAFLPDTGVGRWPVRVLIGHCADADLVLTHRIRRTLGEDRPVLGLWDEESFIDAGLYSPERRPPVAGFVAAIHTMRRWQSELLLTLDDQQWTRRAMHPEQGELTVRWLVGYAAWHLEHHNRFLQAKLDHMLGPRPAVNPDDCAHESAPVRGGGGCGPGCGCVGKAGSSE